MLIAAVCWLALAIWESIAIRGVNAPIRIDLIYIVPAMLLVNLGCPIAVIATRLIVDRGWNNKF